MQQPVSIKGTKKGLVFYFNTDTTEFKDLCQSLEEKLLEARDFFAGATYYISPDAVLTGGQLRIIHEILVQRGLQPGQEEDVSISRSPNEVKAEPQQAAAVSCQENVWELETTSEQPFLLPLEGDTIWFTRGLRSGQQVVVKGNVVILGDVHTGAEVMASGHVVIMGACRGVVHAGAEGDRDALIIIYRLGISQLRIADTSAAVGQQDEGACLQAAYWRKGAIVVGDYQPQLAKTLSSRTEEVG